MARYRQRELQLRVTVPADAKPHDASGFVFPDRPDAALIQAIHRGHDGYVTISRRNPANPDGLENLCSIPANSLPGLFEQLIPLTNEDAYFSVNGYYRGAHWKNRHELKDGAGELLPATYRKATGVRYLTANFCDLDCEKLGLEVGTVIGAVINAQDAGILPAASIITRSGRGVWLFWILTGQDYSTPQPHARSWPDKTELWAKIQGAINTRLSTIGSDSQSKDLARITRIPGSINTKANTRVSYWVQLDEAGQVPRYTMTDLAAAFGIEKDTNRQPPLVRQVRNIYQERASKGQAGRWLKARDNFERLWDLRGRFKIGTRNGAARTYTIILRSLPGNHQLTDEQVNEEVERLYQSFEQGLEPYTLAELHATMRTARPLKLAGIKNQTIADALDITPDEAELLPSWPAASRFTGGTAEPKAKLSRPELAQRRRRFIREYADSLAGRIPTGEELADLIESKIGERPSPTTVLADMKALGISNPRTPRPRTTADRPLLPPESGS